MALTRIDDRGLKYPIDLLDTEKIRLGTDNDLQIHHSAHVNYISSKTGNIVINRVNGEAMAKFIPDGAVELYYDATKKLETTSSGIKGYGTGVGHIFLGDFRVKTEADANFVTFKPGESLVRWHDNHKAVFGASNDLKIYHDGSHNYILSDNGHIHIVGDGTNQVKITAKNNEQGILITPNGAVELFYDNSNKFQTVTDGVRVTGHLHGNDNYRIKLGNGNDLQMYHDGTNSFINNNTAAFILQSDHFRFRDKHDGDVFASFIHDGAVELYHDNSKKFETTSSGIKIFGDASSGTIVQGAFTLRDTTSGSDRIKWFPNSPYTLRWSDNFMASFGSGDDLEIVHNGSHSIAKNKTGDFYLAGNSVKLVNEAINQDMLTATAGGAVQLNNNGTERLKTKSYGVHINGYKTQFNPPGFMGDAADWSSSQPNMHNMTLRWNSGHLNNSTGVFTCPVAGKYLCSASVQAHRTYNTSGASSTYYNVLRQKNNSNYHVEMVGTSSTDAGARSTTDVNGKHETVTATVVIDCAANDTIRAHSNHGYRHNSQNIITVILLG